MLTWCTIPWDLWLAPFKKVNSIGLGLDRKDATFQRTLNQTQNTAAQVKFQWILK